MNENWLHLTYNWEDAGLNHAEGISATRTDGRCIESDHRSVGEDGKPWELPGISQTTEKYCCNHFRKQRTSMWQMRTWLHWRIANCSNKIALHIFWNSWSQTCSTAMPVQVCGTPGKPRSLLVIMPNGTVTARMFGAVLTVVLLTFFGAWVENVIHTKTCTKMFTHNCQNLGKSKKFLCRWIYIRWDTHTLLFSETYTCSIIQWWEKLFVKPQKYVKEH